jgi:hypothetical protein
MYAYVSSLKGTNSIVVTLRLVFVFNINKWKI